MSGRLTYDVSIETRRLRDNGCTEKVRGEIRIDVDGVDVRNRIERIYEEADAAVFHLLKTRDAT